MNNIIEQLIPFLPSKAIARVSEYEEMTFDIIDEKTDEEIGSYSVNEHGELVSFSLFDETTQGDVVKDEIAAIADKFLKTFHPTKKEYELSAILDLDNPYMVVYEKRDETYGLFLHSMGFVVSVSSAGQVTQFHYTEEEYEIQNDDHVITKEEALKQYINQLDFALTIEHYDHEVYKNGDSLYHLSYSLIEHITDVPIDGSDPFSIREENKGECNIPLKDPPNKSVYELVGITSEYRLLNSLKEEGKKTEVWTKNKLLDSGSFEMDEPDNHVVKLKFDGRTERLLGVISGEESENDGEEISLEDAKKNALDFMFKLFPDANERFRIEVLEEFDDVDEFEDDEMDHEFEDEFDLDDDFEDGFDIEDDDVDEQEYIEHEHTYTFYFHLYHQGIRVDQQVSTLDIGKFTGKITNFDLDIPAPELYTHLLTSPKISYDEAKEIYKNQLEMELVFTRDYDENEKAIYKLSYSPSFPATVGHVRAIDAMTGEAMFVDVGDATFL